MATSAKPFACNDERTEPQMPFAEPVILAAHQIAYFLSERKWNDCLLCLSEGTHALASCNWHFSVSFALGCSFFIRANNARREHQHDQAREHTCEGILHLLLGFLAGH
jgi:hypothetical protein